MFLYEYDRRCDGRTLLAMSSVRRRCDGSTIFGGRGGKS